MKKPYLVLFQVKIQIDHFPLEFEIYNSFL